jgi:hypothetical protein
VFGIEALIDEFPILRDICKGLKRNQYPATAYHFPSLLFLWVQARITERRNKKVHFYFVLCSLIRNFVANKPLKSEIK